MATPIITERVLTIDNKSGTPTAFTSILVGGFDALAGKAFPTQDVTGAADANPVKKRTGFTSFSNFKLVFEAIPGGSPDAADDLLINGHLPAGSTRTVKGTFNTTGLTWSFQIEANMLSCIPKVEPGENGITLLETEWECTGAATEVYA